MIVASFASPASAQNWIVGGSVGQAELDSYDAGAATNITSDDTGTAYSIFGGYLFNEWFGLTGAYVDLGEAEFAGTAYSGFTDTLSANGLEISAVGTWALGSEGNFILFGSLGLFDFEQEVDWNDGVSGPWSGNDSGRTTSLGLGLAIPFGDSGWGFHAEYKLYYDIGDDDVYTGSGHESDRTLYQVGIHLVLGDNSD
jgi:OOP family OmpA-OmpF porin